MTFEPDKLLTYLLNDIKVHLHDAFVALRISHKNCDAHEKNFFFTFLIVEEKARWCDESTLDWLLRLFLQHVSCINREAKIININVFGQVGGPDSDAAILSVNRRERRRRRCVWSKNTDWWLHIKSNAETKSKSSSDSHLFVIVFHRLSRLKLVPLAIICNWRHTDELQRNNTDTTQIC